ncbi:MAG: outer membrane protein YfgL, partial [Pseudomonadota bacterium]
VSGVGADAETVAAAARDGSVFALDADGKTRWNVPIGAEVVTVPAVGHGVVVVRSSDNRVTALDAQTGRRRWSFQRQGVPLVLRQTAGIAITPDSVYVGLPGGRLVALNAQSGALRWESAISQPKGATEIERIADIAGTPMLVGREVCAVSFQGRLACADAATGRVVWNREISSSGGIGTDERMIVAADDRGRLHAHSRGGTSLWRQEAFVGRALSSPLVLGALVFVGDQHGALHLLNAADGAVAGRIDVDAPVDSAPVAAGSLAVVQTRAGTLYAITAR